MTPEGRCPRCTETGPIATPCRADACARIGVHRIPPEFARQPSNDPLVGQMLDAWLVLRRVAGGGVGDIYLAEQQPVGLRAALKLITQTDGPLARPERFLREAAALARLTHPNIVRLLAYGVHQTRPYLVMEFIDGARTLARAAPHLSPSEKRRVVIQMTHALQAAHAQGVVHRDLKPANVMLQAVVGEPHFVRLVDFGLARFEGDSDHSTIVAGSPHYMAPEQIARDRIGPFTDVYALAALTLEIFSGERPFRGPTINAVLLLKSDPAYDPVADAEPRLDPRLAALLRDALARNPAERIATAAAFRAAFEALGPMPDPPLAPTGPMRRSPAQVHITTEAYDDTASRELPDPPPTLTPAPNHPARAPGSTAPLPGSARSPGQEPPRRSDPPRPDAHQAHDPHPARDSHPARDPATDRPRAPEPPPRPHRALRLTLIALVALAATALALRALDPGDHTETDATARAPLDATTQTTAHVIADATPSAPADAIPDAIPIATPDATPDAMTNTALDAQPPTDATPPTRREATPRRAPTPDRRPRRPEPRPDARPPEPPPLHMPSTWTRETPR